jgi:hypothetical protein
MLPDFRHAVVFTLALSVLRQALLTPVLPSYSTVAENLSLQLLKWREGEEADLHSTSSPPAVSIS